MTNTNTNTVLATLETVTQSEFVDQGWFSTVTIVAPSSDKYFDALAWLGYSGDINLEPDKAGVVTTGFTAEDGMTSVVVGFQGERPAKQVDSEGNEIDDSDIESDDED